MSIMGQVPRPHNIEMVPLSMLLLLKHLKIFLSIWMTSLLIMLSTDNIFPPLPTFPRQQEVTGRGSTPVSVGGWQTTLLTWPTTFCTACWPGVSCPLGRLLLTLVTPPRQTRSRRGLGGGEQESSELCGRRPLPCKRCQSKRRKRRNSRRMK